MERGKNTNKYVENDKGLGSARLLPSVDILGILIISDWTIIT